VPDPIEVADEAPDDWLPDEEEWGAPPPPPPPPPIVQRPPAPPKIVERPPAPPMTRAAPKVAAPPAPPPEVEPTAGREPAAPKAAFAPRVVVGWEKPENATPARVHAAAPPPRNPAADRIRMAARRVNAHPRLAVNTDESQRDRREQVLAHLMADESPPPDSQTAAEWAAMCSKLKPPVEPGPEPNYWRWRQ
jgi:hypothetical protein